MTQTVARYGEQGSIAATYCSASRTCVQTNLIAAGFAAAFAPGAGMVSLGKRVVRIA